MPIKIEELCRYCDVPVSDARRMSWHTQLTSPWCHGGPDRVRDGGENTERRFNA